MTLRNQKGFTLIEVIISIAALGIICAVLLKLFVLAGDTNRRAGDIQEAQVAVVSVTETLVGAETLNSGLDMLGLPAPSGDVDGQYTLQHGSFLIVLEINQAFGDYPGELYDLSVKAVADERDLASIQTARYIGGSNR